MAAFDTTPGSCYGGPAVAAFTPICSFDPLTPTTPATFDVPAPHIVLPLPPQECVCFDFTHGTANVTTTPSCREDATAAVGVTIAPDTDCCSGKYVITPTLDLSLPCMPFSVKETSVVVKNKTGATTNVDGAATLTIEKGTDDECCSLVSALELTLPKCVKYHGGPDDMPEVQITYCERDTESVSGVATKTHRFVEIVENPEECTFYPVVHPIELPCCTLADANLGSGRVYTDGYADYGYGSYFDWSLDREDCNVALSLDPHVTCPCFTFTSGEKRVSPTNIPQAKIRVEIARNSDNCCDPGFTITPDIEIPICTLGNVTKTGSFSIDNRGGYVDWTMSRVNCDWNFAFNAHPSTTCILPALDITRTAYLGRVGNANTGSLTVHLKRTNDCNWDLDVTSTPIEIDIPVSCVPKIEVKDTYLNVKYKKNGVPKETDSGTETPQNDKGAKFWWTKDNNTCPTYTLNIGKLDLTDIGSSVGNGGVVFQTAGGGGGGGSSGDLYIDGNTTGNTAWYGGGLGDLLDDVVNQVKCRGPIMRGVSSPFAEERLIPNSSTPTKIISNQDGRATVWSSTRSQTDDETGEMTRLFPTSITVDNETMNCVTGNLSMRLPTGFQWDPGQRGLAVPFSEFVFNDSGILSYMEETGTSGVIAPGIAMGGQNGNLHVSGLKAWPVGEGRQADMPYYGLHVDYGPGLHIYKGPNGTSRQYYDNPSDAAGALMLNDGRGLRVHGVTKMTADGKTETTVSDEHNKIEIYRDTKDLAFTAAGQLALNDKATASASAISDSTGAFVRRGGSDCSMTCAVVSTTNYWTSGSLDVTNTMTTLNNLLPTLIRSGSATNAAPAYSALSYVNTTLQQIVGWLSAIYTRKVHISDSGLVLAVNGDDTAPTSRNITA